MSDSTTWLEMMLPNIRRFEVAAAINGTACWNAKGSKAMAQLLRKMCGIIDDEIMRRGGGYTAGE